MGRQPCVQFDLSSVPMLGAAYYPEDWDEAEQEHDIAYMKKAGLTVVRIGEFAWKKMEPHEGEYDFVWMHRVIDKLAAAGIRVVLGTPSATPPIWVEEKDPSMRKQFANGMQTQHGGRRHCCSNNAVYVEYSLRIAEKMAKEFQEDPNVIGWQIDNEICVFDEGCFCAACKQKFKTYLKERYGTVETLNARWNLNLFSQAYDSFDQIPAPNGHSWHNPHLLYEWNRFQSLSQIEFVRKQADILHKYVHVPVGTDMMPFFHEDYEAMNHFLDVIQYNHYDTVSDVWRENFWFDYVRGFKEIPFWNTETLTCWNGSTCTPPDARPEGFCRANAWLPIVLGGGANLFWLWRQHWAGHELMHGSVLYASGRPLHIFEEIRKTAEEYQKASAFLSGTRIKTDTAVMVTTQSYALTRFQEIIPEMWSDQQLTGDAYVKRVQRIHAQVISAGIRPDVIPAGRSLDRYQLLFTPYLMTLEDGDLPARIREWVQNGGVWVAGPLTDIRDDIGAHYRDRETGMLEQLTGAVLTDTIPDASHMNSCQWTDGRPFESNMVLQLFRIPEDAESLVQISDGHSALIGKTVVFEKKYGKGSILVLGTQPSDKDMHLLIVRALRQSGASFMEIRGDLAAAVREGEAGEGISLTEYSGRQGEISFEGKMKDLLTGQIYSGHAEVGPYQPMILKKI